MFHHVNTTTERARIIARNPKPWDNDTRQQEAPEILLPLRFAGGAGDAAAGGG